MRNFIIFTLLLAFFSSCEYSPQETKSATGVSKAKITMTTDQNGHTSEQTNIMERYKIDNQPGSVKHLYLIAPMSGQVLLYSTVKGKVTSGSKRLTPSSIAVNNYAGVETGMVVDINGKKFLTEEVLGDDGTYGSSSDYIYWFDIRGAYHQHFIVPGSVIVHVSDQPIAVKNIIINIESLAEKTPK